ncbi:MAG TPA: FtsX-like permease family protein [Verrucomicrobiota bacterium]|nr:FtsX-like permease family protein [Verrucomicrobiota bacterium]HNT16119.1 FtsX-like permease family protein [Verrucomicrobiota bacterium]
MKLSHLIRREILHRKLGFALATVSAAVAVAGLVAARAMLQKHDARTEQIITAREAQTRAQMARMEDDYRKMMLKMGFNVLILPKDQNLGDLYAEDYASKYMPEEYATRLARSRVVTINHILPSLQQKIQWPEYARTVLLMGVRGEVYVQNARQQPLLAPVAAGTMVLGHELAKNLKLEAGQQTKLMGREFTVARINPERGNKDDITVWINLAEAQSLLDKPGLINGILALDCTCDTLDRLARIRPEIARILPDTQIVEYASQALARAEARQRAATEAQASLQREKEGRTRLRQEREALAAVLVPVITAGSGVWLGLLALANVRERRDEIGILRALGLRSRQILLIFLGKAVVIGLAGAGLGYALGRGLGMWWRETPDAAAPTLGFWDVHLLALVLVAAPLLAALASWLPALIAAQQDPADVLREA